MRDALATWHMGRVIYAYRTHPWHPQPLSQEAVGNWLGLTQAQLSRIENGRAPEEISKLSRWARILGVPGELLWFKLPVQEDDDRADARSDHHHLPMGDADELEHLAAALGDARRYLDSSVVGFFRDQLAKGKADDGAHGPGNALPLMLGILGAIAQHVREVRPGVRRELLALGAEASEFTGWLYRDLQKATRARFWYDRAMEWAQEANDTAMQGYVLLKKSQMAYDERDAYRVASLAEAASQGPWELPARIRAEVIQQRALGLAVTGEPISSVQEHMHAAREVLAQAPLQAEESASICFTTDTLLLRQATCYTEAGKPARAAALFDSVITSGRLTRRDLGFFQARQATALALSGEPDEAASVGLQAIQTAQETNSERTIRILGETVDALKPWSGRPGPRALSHAVLTCLR